MEAEQQQLRNLRDFLLVYNKMSELCFTRCAKNLNYRNLTVEEESCLDSCASKLIRSNHRLMASYVALMPGLVQRRMAEYESKEAAKDPAAAVLPGNSGSDVSSNPGQMSPPVPAAGTQPPA